MHRLILLLVIASVAVAESNAGGGGSDGSSGGGGGGGQGADAPPSTGGTPWIFIIFFVIMGFMLWSTFRTQKKDKQRLAQLIENLKVGDTVETIGGLRGEVVRRGESEFDIKTGGESVITIAAGAVKTRVGDDDRKE